MGLQISKNDASYTDYAPMMRTENPVQLISLIIEEEELAQEIFSRMIAAGVPIVENMDWQ